MYDLVFAILVLGFLLDVFFWVAAFFFCGARRSESCCLLGLDLMFGARSRWGGVVGLRGLGYKSMRFLKRE